MPIQYSYIRLFIKQLASRKLSMLVIVMCIFIISLGVYGIAGMKIMNDNAQTLYTDRLIPLQQLTGIRFSYNSELLSFVEQRHAHGFDFSEASKKIDRIAATIEENWKNYLHTYLTPAESLLAKQTSASMLDAHKAIDTLTAILLRKDIRHLDFFLEHEWRTGINPVIKSLSVLIHLQVNVGAEVGDTKYLNPQLPDSLDPLIPF